VALAAFKLWNELCERNERESIAPRTKRTFEGVREFFLARLTGQTVRRHHYGVGIAAKLGQSGPVMSFSMLSQSLFPAGSCLRSK
jgi:hypothetical protein